MPKVKEPTIKKNGVTFDLKEVPTLYISRFMSDYEKTHAKPVPPMRVVKYIKEEHLEPDLENAYYKEQKEDYDRSFGLAYTNFMICLGVKNDPPSDWQPAFEFGETLNKNDRKVLWIGEYFPSQDDLTELSTAITSINQVTEEGLKEAEKNLG